MLDKSIPYKDIIMAIDPERQKQVAPSPLPGGYFLRRYEDGDELHWARIEASVHEFDSQEEALAHFMKEYRPHRDLLSSRLVFACRPDGLPVANSSAWFDSQGRSMLHWVATCPEYQGKGLGKAVVQECIHIAQKLHPHQDMYLHTQTWSHVAVRMYYGIGFRFVRDPHLFSGKNDFEGAIQVLKKVYPESFITELTASAR